MKIEVNLPVEIVADDYHEFAYVQDHMRKMNRRITVKEVAFNWEGGNYIGVAYCGRKTDPENKAFIRKLQEKYKDPEDDDIDL